MIAVQPSSKPMELNARNCKGVEHTGLAAWQTNWSHNESHAVVLWIQVTSRSGGLSTTADMVQKEECGSRSAGKPNGTRHGLLITLDSENHIEVIGVCCSMASDQILESKVGVSSRAFTGVNVTPYYFILHLAANRSLFRINPNRKTNFQVSRIF